MYHIALGYRLLSEEAGGHPNHPKAREKCVLGELHQGSEGIWGLWLC